MESVLLVAAIAQVIFLIWFIVTLNGVLRQLKELNEQAQEFQAAMTDISRRAVLELRELNGKRPPT